MLIKVWQKCLEIVLKINRSSEKKQTKKHLCSKIFGELWDKRNTTDLFRVGLIKGLALLKHLYLFPTVA